MEILKNERNGNEVTLEIELGYEQVEKAAEKSFARVAKEMKIPGFRPGKAPKEIVEQHVNKDALKEDAAYQAISDAYPQLLEQIKIKPVDQPKVEIIQLRDGQPLIFKVTVDVYPEIKLGKYKGLKADKKSAAVSEDEVNKVVLDIQNRFAAVNEVKERGAANNDIVDINLSAELDGKPYIPLTRNGIKLLIGQAGITKEFDDQLIGLKKGENKSFSVIFPGDYVIEEVRAKDIKFNVYVNKVEERILPAADDSFAKTLGSFTGIADLKEKILQDIKAAKEREADEELRNNLIQQVSENAKVDVPMGMIDREVSVMLDELRHNLKARNISLEDYLMSLRKDEKAIKDEMRPGAASRVLGQLVLEAIAEAENITATQQEAEKEVEKIALESNRNLDEFKKNLRPGTEDYIIEYLSRLKALEFLVQNAKINAL